MSRLHPQFFDKIVNPELARAALHGAEAFGEFKVYVRLAEPKAHPPYMKVTGKTAPDMIKGRIPCDQIQRVENDSNVLLVELREHIAG